MRRVRSAAGALARRGRGSTDRDSYIGGAVGADADVGGAYATRPNRTRDHCRRTRSVNANSGGQIVVMRCIPC